MVGDGREEGRKGREAGMQGEGMEEGRKRGKGGREAGRQGETVA